MYNNNILTTFIVFSVMYIYDVPLATSKLAEKGLIWNKLQLHRQIDLLTSEHSPEFLSLSVQYVILARKLGRELRIAFEQ